jgi:hypothetical protein
LTTGPVGASVGASVGAPTNGSTKAIATTPNTGISTPNMVPTNTTARPTGVPTNLRLEDIKSPSIVGGRVVWREPPIKMNNIPRYRLDHTVKFRWGYDENLDVLPRNLTLAFSAERRLWTNITHLPGSATEYDWDLAAWDTVKNGPLITDVPITIGLFDERGMNVPSEAGLMNYNLDMHINFYTSYPMNKCATCFSNAPTMSPAATLIAPLALLLALLTL